MNIPEIVNRTGFGFTPLFLSDEEARPLLVLITRASFQIIAGGGLALAPEQLPITPEGQWFGKPGSSSYRLEPDIAFTKTGTDVVLLGSACAPRTGVSAMDVGLRVGPVQKIVRVFGDRRWVRGLTGLRISEPMPFERMQLAYERAFGGWDRSDPDPTRHEFDLRNPVGIGYRAPKSKTVEDLGLPNLEDPSALIGSQDDRPYPAGFGFTSGHWQPRAVFAGTYDDAWQRSRSPRLPTNFDRRFFGAASAGLCAQPYLRGDEPVLAQGVSAGGPLACALPGFGQANYAVRLRNQPPSVVRGSLDTVVVDADQPALHLTWRAFVALPRGAQDVVDVEISFPEASQSAKALR
jgi:hypothetical protein